MKIAIVGGGIGGLAAAISCAESGNKVVVLERRDEFTEFGAGIQLAPNAFHALDYLGVGDQVRERAVQIGELRLMDGLTGNVITRLPLGKNYQDKFENPYMVVHRTDLYYPLLDACRANDLIELRTSCKVNGYQQTDTGARVIMSNGDYVTADMVIGADGLHSVVRQQLVGDGGPRVSGHTIYRSVIPMEKVPKELQWDAVALWAGPKWHFVHYPIAGGKFMNLAATRDNQAPKAVAGESISHSTVITEFEGMDDVAKNLLQLGEGWKKWVMCDRDPVDNWTDGRVALLGDAAHPMLQYAAQGACMALEDAVTLGEIIKQNINNSPQSLLREYNVIRRNRAAKVVTTARGMGEQVYHPAGDKAFKRNVSLGSLTPNEIHNKIEWLHGMRPPYFGESPAEASSFKKIA